MNSTPLTLTLGFCALGAASMAATPSPQGEVVAIKAGRIHTMEAAGVIENGTLLVRDGRIVAVGQDIAIPPSAQVVDYGPYADLIPGLVAADSGLGRGSASDRYADLGLFAVDNFDPFSNRAELLAAGITSAYVDTTNSRLLSGVGGVVKLAGAPDQRVIDGWATLDGSISGSAYGTPAFWEPPVPATADVGMGVAEPQLPDSLPGAMLALEMIVDMAAGKPATGFGPHLAGDLKMALEKGATWRLTANSETELRALANFAKERNLRIVVDGAWDATEVIEELKSSRMGVVFQPRQRLGTVTNWGKGDADWPTLNVPEALVKAGVPVAVATGDAQPLSSLYQTAMLASGGLTRDQALALVTSSAAKMIGADDRVGSLRVGKDADFVVLTGAPMTAGSSVRATWVNGEVAFNAKALKSSTDEPTAQAVVLEVDELHIGDGTVMRPGQVLMVDGLIREVGAEVSRPRGAMVIRGAAAMPGIVDSYGHLGLDGSRSTPSAGTSYSRFLMPGDETAKHVAEAGVTTVLLAPYNVSGSGSTLMAYKPATDEYKSMVVEDDAALHIVWSSNNRYGVGDNVRAMLQKAVEYRNEWVEYEQAMAKWTPPADEPEEEAKAEEGKDDEAKADEAKGDDDKGDEDKDKDKKKKKKEKDPDPLTGVWTATEEWGSLRFQFKDQASEETTEIRGSVRSDALSDKLLRFEGTFDHKEGVLNAKGSDGFAGLVLTGKIDEEKLTGTIAWNAAEHSFTAARESREYVVVTRPVVRPEESESTKAPKGMPKEPRLDANMEPWRGALEGRTSVIVTANRQDEILDAVAAFEGVGIQPILMGASEAWRVRDQIAGRVKGVMPSLSQLRDGDGLIPSNRFAQLQGAGIPVAFYSDAEEGAGDLLMLANFAVIEGMSSTGAVRALTGDSAKMMGIESRVGRLAPGLDADVLLLSAGPTAFGVSVLRTWIGGEEVLR